MPRRSLTLTLLAALSLLMTGCDRRSPSGTVLSTNVAELTEALRSRSAERREAAVRLIAEHSVPVETRELIRILDDSNPAVRRFGAEALGKRRDAEALKPLFRLLQDDDWYVRSETATAVGHIGDPRAAGWLVQLLTDGDAYVRYSAGSALREIATESHREQLLEAFHRAQPLAQSNLAIVLAKLHEPSVLPAVTSLLQTNDVVLRRRATEALGDYAAADVTNSLAQLLHDEDVSVREEAARALRRVQAEER